MFDVEKILLSSGMTLEDPLSIKEDRAVLRVQRADTGSFILRLYQKEVPAYCELERSWCEGFPQVYRTYEEEGLFVVEEEDVEGISLQEHLMQTGKLAEKEAVELMQQLCSSLKTLHGLGYIHRDVKPEHILLTADQKAVLIDLDASMGIQPEKKNDTMLIGTALYAAPEQFGLTRSDVRSDVYALGILLNEMLTGNHPTVMQYRNGHLGKIIETCTKINPDDRYQSMGELMNTLGDLTKYPAPGLPLIRQSRTMKLAAVGVAAVVILLGAGWFAAENPSASVPENTILAYTDELPYSPEYAKPPVKAEGEAPAMEGEWLQLYKYDRMEDYAHVHRDGGQGARYYIEDGTLVDHTYEVYCDPQVGVVNGWLPENGGWDIVSQNCDAGATGYIYAEKDGKKYAIDVLVLTESMAAYTSLPTAADFTEGYLQSRRIGGKGDTYAIDYTYNREESVTLYLAAAMGMDVLEVRCTSPLVSIEPCEPYGLWHGPVYKLTFENPDGGDTWFEVTSNMNPLTFYMKEELLHSQ